MAGKPRLSQEERAEIFRLYREEHMTQRDLAARFGVSHGTIGNIINSFGSDTLAAADKPQKKTQINDDFEQAVDTMIAEREAADAEQKSATAEPEKLPDVIWHACDDKISMINLDIETREQRIGELKEEIEQLCAEREQIRAWMEEHT